MRVGPSPRSTKFRRPAAGDIGVLTGPGCGKTTLLRAVAG
jgi:ABC-type transport system involved in cytochrome c biogenesis ATPase subunit